LKQFLRLGLWSLWIYLVSRDGVGVKGEIVSLFLRVGRGEEEAMRGGDSVWLQVVGDSDGRRLLQTEHSLSHGRVGGQGRVMVELLHYPQDLPVISRAPGGRGLEVGGAALVEEVWPSLEDLHHL
jgi:hypothetical protein